MLEFVRFGLDNPYQYEIMFMIRDEVLSYCRSEQGRCFEMFAMLVRQYLLEENYSEEERRTVPLTLFCRAWIYIVLYSGQNWF